MSETKKVVSCDFKSEYTHPQYGTGYNFVVKFEGDEKAYQYTGKDKANPYFKVGETVTYDVEVKSGEKDGSTYTFYKLKPVRPAGGGFAGKGFAKKGKAEYLCESSQFTMSYIKDLIVAGKVDVKDWVTKAEEIMKFNEKKIAEYLKPE